MLLGAMRRHDDCQKSPKLWAPLELSCNRNRRDRVWSGSAQRFGCVRIIPQDCDWNSVFTQDHMTSVVSVVSASLDTFVCFYKHLSIIVLEFRNSWPRFSTLLHLLICSYRRGDVRLAKNITTCDSWVWCVEGIAHKWRSYSAGINVDQCMSQLSKHVNNAAIHLVKNNQILGWPSLCWPVWM